ncbi:hypothetical protein HT031_000958 [Scenedesmus sp. PABB004]|nr:hypothetical protein HT031_000958 [Scenedesmus sp. PABB004]
MAASANSRSGRGTGVFIPACMFDDRADGSAGGGDPAAAQTAAPSASPPGRAGPSPPPPRPPAPRRYSCSGPPRSHPAALGTRASLDLERLPGAGLAPSSQAYPAPWAVRQHSPPVHVMPHLATAQVAAHGGLQAYSPAPQAYSPAPQAYSPAPAAYSPTLAAYSPTPAAYALTPAACSPMAQGFVPAPLLVQQQPPQHVLLAPSMGVGASPSAPLPQLSAAPAAALAASTWQRRASA